jgi:hypothetical protein
MVDEQRVSLKTAGVTNLEHQAASKIDAEQLYPSLLFASLQRGESVARELFVFGGASLTVTAQWSEHKFSFTFKRDVLIRVYQTIVSNV